MSRTSFEQTYKKHLASEQRREVMSTLRATLRRDTTLGEVVDAASKVGWSEAMGELTLADLANALVADDDASSSPGTGHRSATEAREEVAPDGLPRTPASLAAEPDASLGKNRAGTRRAPPVAAVMPEPVATKASPAASKKVAKKVAARAATSDTKSSTAKASAAAKAATVKSTTTKAAAPTSTARKTSARTASAAKSTPAKASSPKSSAAKKKTTRR